MTVQSPAFQSPKSSGGKTNKFQMINNKKIIILYRFDFSANQTKWKNTCTTSYVN